MALFKFRKGSDAPPSAPAQAETVEVLRRRARHRLIGAAVLVLLAVIGFPMLFDTQPRPVAVDIPIEIPDRNKAKPLTVPTAPAAQVPAVAAAPQPVPAQAQAQAQPARPAAEPPAAMPMPQKAASAPPRAAEAKPPALADAKSPARPEPRAEARPDTRAEAPKPAPAASKPAARDDGTRAQALLEGKPLQVAAPAEAGEGRFIVQVGAFTDATKARETRLKAERAGLKTYTQVVETKDGKRIRVRVGPFATRAEADKAAGRLKELDLSAAILTL